MIKLDKFFAPNALAAELLDRLHPVLLLGARWYVGWQFLKSGLLKVTSWDQTLYLFENEYHTPLLPPHVAAVAGASGELFFSSLLIIGLMGRFSSIGLSAVNVLAVISYANVLLASGSEAALAQHVLWGTLLLVLTVFGPGLLSLDRLLTRSRI